jgi:hypothetical protein
MVAGIEPAVVGVAEAAEGADVDHAADLGTPEEASSVIHVTGSDRISAGIVTPEVVKIGTSTRARKETAKTCRLPWSCACALKREESGAWEIVLFWTKRLVHEGSFGVES